MKKRICTMLLITAMLVTSSLLFAFADTSNDSEIKSSDVVINSVDNPTIEIDDGGVMDFIMSIKDDVKKDIILDYWTAPAYYIVGDSYVDQKSSLEFIKDLAALSIDEIYTEIGNSVSKAIQENKNDPNVFWDKDYIDTYVASYASNQKSNLESKTMAKIDATNIKNSIDSISQRASNKIPEGLASYNTNGSLQYSLFCTVKWNYSGGKVTYVGPTTTHNVGSGYAWEGYDISGEDLYENDSYAIIEKQGRFSDPNGTNRYIYIWILVDGQGGSNSDADYNNHL